MASFEKNATINKKYLPGGNYYKYFFYEQCSFLHIRHLFV